MAQPYIVTVEADTDEVDELDFQVDLRGMHNMGYEFNSRVAVGITNTASKMGLVGFIVSCIAMLITLAGVIMYAIWYPYHWWENAADNWRLPLTAAFLGFGVMAQIIGFLLSTYGRRILAQGQLVSLNVQQES